MLRLLLLLPLLLIAPDVFAEIFEIKPTDKSVEYLGIIFGGNVGSISLGGSANPILSDMFEKFNTIFLSIASLVLAYVAVVSTINTAKEGQAMGRKWSSVWMPMRAILGLLLMVPAPGSGYSLIQITVMWIVMQGIGAANGIWDIVLDQLATGVSATGTIKGLSDDTLKPFAQQLLNSAVCMEALNKITSGNDDFITNKYGKIKSFAEATPTTTKKDAKGIATSATSEMTFYFGIKGNNELQDVCGKYTINTTGSGTDAVNDAEETRDTKFYALLAMYNALQPIAKTIVNDATKTPMVFTPAGGYVPFSYEAYNAEIVKLAEDPADLNEDIEDAIKSAKENGWIHAGSYYAAMSIKSPGLEIQAQTLPAGRDILTMYVDKNNESKLLDEVDPESIEGKSLGKSLANAIFYFPLDISKNKSSSLVTVGNTTGNGDVKEFLDLFMTPFTKLVTDWFTEDLTGEDQDGEDPLLSIASFGTNMMFAAEIAWIAIMILAATVSSSAGIGFPFNPLIFGWQTVLFFMVPIVLGVLVLFWGVGATFGIYLPFVPYIIFAAAALGWFVAVIEAIIAAPLVALGLISPSGDELGKIQPALMILANIFLRPTLMIFGFILAARLLQAILKLINFGFTASLDNLGGVTGFGIIAVMVLYGGLVISIVNKCFTLIYIIPDKIMRWIGGGTESSGMEADLAAKTQASFDQGSGAVSKVQRGGMDAAASKRKAIIDNTRKDK